MEEDQNIRTEFMSPEGPEEGSIVPMFDSDSYQRSQPVKRK